MRLAVGLAWKWCLTLLALVASVIVGFVIEAVAIITASALGVEAPNDFWLAGFFAASMFWQLDAKIWASPTQAEVRERNEMDRSPQFMDGYRFAAKAAVEWLHLRAVEMNDPHAKQVLDSAAFNMGTDFKRGQIKERIEE